MVVVRQSFGSDNHSGVDPAVFEALAVANEGHQPAYGKDSVTRAAELAFQESFGTDCDVFFVFTGTAANTLAIRAACQSFEAVVVTDIAHLNEDECGAPEFVTGSKLLSFPHENGKLRLEHIEKLAIDCSNPHRVVPRLISLTQATEFGTVYSLEEIQAICSLAHQKGMLVHMDGARLANAAAYLQVDLASLTVKAGVDLLSFGGTKNGLLCAEAVVIFRKDLARNFGFYRKQSLQLAAKMRYLSCQFIPYLKEQLWLTNATHANQMAQYLRTGLAHLPGVSFPFQTEANEVFATVPQAYLKILQEQWSVPVWNEAQNLVRFVTSFDTRDQAIDLLLTELQKIDQTTFSPR